MTILGHMRVFQFAVDVEQFFLGILEDIFSRLLFWHILHTGVLIDVGHIAKHVAECGIAIGTDETGLGTIGFAVGTHFFPKSSCTQFVFSTLTQELVAISDGHIQTLVGPGHYRGIGGIPLHVEHLAQTVRT